MLINKLSVRENGGVLYASITLEIFEFRQGSHKRR